VGGCIQYTMPLSFYRLINFTKAGGGGSIGIFWGGVPSYTGRWVTQSWSVIF